MLFVLAQMHEDLVCDAIVGGLCRGRIPRISWGSIEPGRAMLLFSWSRTIAP
jgi:hypothetical protein